MFPGFLGIAASLGVLAVVWLIVSLRTKGTSFRFDPGGVAGEFGRTLLPMYLDMAKFIMGMAAGSIVLLVGSSNFYLQAGSRSLRSFTSPLFVVAMSIVYGVLFMTFLVLNYEHDRHHPDLNSYTRFKYVRNQALGFSSLACFCIGYWWLVFNATR